MGKEAARGRRKHGRPFERVPEMPPLPPVRPPIGPIITPTENNVATYAELYALHLDNDDLLHRVIVATWLAAEAIRVEIDTTPNHANRMIWASGVFGGAGGQQMLNAVLAANADASVAQITGATDAQILAKVNDAVDLVAGV